MAWTAPRTYVANEVVTAAILNTDHRDNLLALSTHVHTGAAGDGDDDLTGLDTLTLDDQAANPAVAGRMQRNGNDLYWYGSAVYKITNHTHTPSEVGISNDAADNQADTLSTAGFDNRVNLTTSEQTLATLSRTPGGANRVFSIVTTCIQHYPQSEVAHHSWQYRIYVGGVQRVNKSIASVPLDGANSHTYQRFAAYTEVNPAEVSQAVDIKALHNNDQTNVPRIVHTMLVVTEVQVT